MSLPSPPLHPLTYSKDNGETWEIYDTEGIDVYEGDTISVKCMLNNSHSYGYAFITNNTYSDVKAKIQGNIMSLLLSDNFMGVTALLESCLYSLFQNCEWLIDAQNLVLPATTLVEECYSNMFFGCKNLVTAPELPATTLANGCYQSMFIYCNNLNYIKCLATNLSFIDVTKDWLKNVASTGTFVKAAGMEGWLTGTSGIPSGWTVVDA